MALILTKDGSHSIHSEQFGAAYHSTFGAVTESAHVFIGAGFQAKSAGAEKIDVLEAGFGSGLNAFMTWLEAEKSGINAHYVGLEAYPLAMDAVSALNYPALFDAPEREERFLGLHRCEWGRAHTLSPRFTFEKRKTDIRRFSEPESFDLVYFDAFAPQTQAELWTLDVIKSMFHSLRPGGILVTYCAQGAFRRTLRQAGFSVERLPGAAGKFEMTRATKRIPAGNQ